MKLYRCEEWSIMKRFRRVLLCLAAVMAVPMLFAADPTISLTATPRYPWNGLVDLAFTIGADETEGGYAEHQPGDDAIVGYRLKYVQSAGDAQLNTGVVPGSKNTIELKFAWESQPGDNGCLFCARGAATQERTFTGFLIGSKWRFDYNMSAGTESATPTLVSGKSVVIRDIAGTASVDGTSVQSFTESSFTVGGPIALFASYVGAPGERVSNYVRAKVYYLKIFGDDGMTLLHDFVPWEKDGVVGMYDMIAKRFVAPNVGTLTCGTQYDTSFSVQDVAGGTNLTMKTLYKSSGEKANVALEKLVSGTYNWLWDAPSDLGADFASEGVVIDVKVGNAVTYTVKFNANGGTGSMANETFESGVAKALTANAFKRTGYLFQGWATSADGAKVYSDKQVVTDLTSTAGGMVNLYALWKNNSYSVKFNANGGTGTMSNEAMEIGVAKALTANAFSRTGYTFSGWATSASGTKVYSDKQSVTDLTKIEGDTVNLYAVWKAVLPVVNGLVAYWSFDGDINDHSGNAHHLAGSVSGWTKNRNSVDKMAASFTGASSLSQTTSLSHEGSLTFTCWAKPSGTDNYPEGSYGDLSGCMGFGNNGMDWYTWPLILSPIAGSSASNVGTGFSVGKNRVIVLARSNQYYGVILNYKGSFSSGWHHFAVVCAQGAAPKLYVDGASVKASALSMSKYKISKSTQVGGGSSSHASMKYSGYLDDLCIYDRALSSAEVKQLYQAK